MRVLVVEDEVLVSLDLADVVTDLGHEVVGPFMNVRTALPQCRAEEVDFAILDFNLRNETSEPLADALLEGTVPFVFLTGYRLNSLPPRFRQVHVLSKPLDPGSLSDLLERVERGV